MVNVFPKFMLSHILLLGRESHCYSLICFSLALNYELDNHRSLGCESPIDCGKKGFQVWE